MRIIRATHLGMCFGVRDAIALAVEHADSAPLTILGDLVHNPTVLRTLEAKGIQVAQEVRGLTGDLDHFRQDAAVELARAADVVIVIGGRTSNNTRELVKTCGRYCSRVYHVQTAADLSAEWFRDAHTVGITAGTSTPDEVIDRVEEQIRQVEASSDRMRWAVVIVFAIAMAWVEAASVFYIRALADRIEPYQVNPLPIDATLGSVELWREAATLVMLATLGVLAGSTWRRRAGYAALAFGAWDIFYYVFLRIMSGWPRTVLDWDILFLLPLPWWGPVLAPVSIALLMIVWGTLATQSRDAATEARWAWALGSAGIALALAVFMIDAWRVLPHGRETVLRVLPDDFNWPLFGAALLLMAAPVAFAFALRLRRDGPARTTSSASP